MSESCFGCKYMVWWHSKLGDYSEMLCRSADYKTVGRIGNVCDGHLVYEPPKRVCANEWEYIHG